MAIDNDLCETSQPTQQSVLNRSGKDKFILVFNLPYILRKQSTENPLIDITPLQISVYGAVVPTIQVPPVEVRFGGQSYNVPSYTRPNYPPLNVNFIIDNNFKNYWLLWKWLAILNDPRNSNYSGTPDNTETKVNHVERGNLTEYQTNISILGLNEYNQKTIEFIYYNAFITSLGSINYNYRDSEILESVVEFQFSQFDVKLLT
jgi:hypothetical protein